MRMSDGEEHGFTCVPTHIQQTKSPWTRFRDTKQLAYIALKRKVNVTFRIMKARINNPANTKQSYDEIVCSTVKAQLVLRIK